MKRTFSSRLIAATVIVGAMFGAATVAQAHPDVRISIGLPGLPFLPPLPGLPVFMAPAPAPVYVQPAPVYVQPAPVYVQPREVYAPEPAVVYERSWQQPTYRYDFERERAWRHAEWQRREWERRQHEGNRYPSSPDRRGWN